MASTTEKLFAFAGVSDLNGQYKVRFANDASRIKVLKANGHEDIRLAQLDAPVTKIEAINEIKDMPGFADADAQAAFADFFASQEPKAPKVKKAAKVEELKAALEELKQDSEEQAQEEQATAEVEVIKLDQEEQATAEVEVIKLDQEAIAQAAELEQQTA